MRPEQRRRLAELPGGGWEVGGVDWSDRQIALTRYLSATESQVWLLDMASGALKQVLPAAGQPAATHLAQLWKKDDSGFFVLGDRGGEFRELLFYRLADARLVRISRAIPWNIESVSLDASGAAAGGARQRRGPQRAALLRRRQLRRAAQPGSCRRQRRAGAAFIRACRCSR